MDEFCDQPLWDRNLTWNTTDPYFTLCFEEFVLGCFPSSFLIVFALVDLNFSLSCKLDPIRVLIFGWIKRLLSLGLMALNITYLIRQYMDINEDKVEGSTINNFAPAFKTVSYVKQHFFLTKINFTKWLGFNFTSILVEFNAVFWPNFAPALCLCLDFLSKIQGVRSSGIQWMFWFFSLVCEGVLFRTAITKISIDSLDVWTKLDSPYLMRLISFPLVVIQFILHCISEENFTKKGSQKLIGNPCPEKSSSFFSKLTYLWFDRMSWNGYRRQLDYNDLWDLNQEDKSETQIPKFIKEWELTKEKAKKLQNGKTGDANILSIIFKCYWKPFILGGILKLITDLLIFIQPEMLKLLVNHISNLDEESWKGYFYAAILLIVSILQNIFNIQHSKRMLLIGMRIKTVLCGAIYRKALAGSNTIKQGSTAGEIINLMSVDTQRLVDLTPMIHMVWTSPIRIAISTYFLYQTLNSAVFSGLGVMILLIPINGFIATKSRVLNMKQMVLKDYRVKLMNEIFSSMKVLKLYGWQISFEDRIKKIREKEIKLLRTSALLNASTVFTFTCAPFFVAIATFGTYVYQNEGNVLNAEKAFVSLSLLNIMRMPLTLFPMVIGLLVQACVSITRINKYMNSSEIDLKAVTHENSKDPVIIENGTFSWSDESMTLQNINLNIKSGSLIAIVGTVGSGKSSLLHSLLGDLKKHNGYVNINGSLAYVAQSAWIQNATLRDNILFGDTYKENKYKKIVDCCALKPDLEILEGGDQTEIGERGINMSGGQKQRISLARAAYKECDIYLFDDPLSAVDAHVGKHIFTNLICGHLQGKTRLLVTHSVSFLSKVDNIVVMKDGKISEIGNFKELLEKRGEFADFLMEHLSSGDIEGDLDIIEDQSIIQDLEKVVKSEEFARRSISMSCDTTRSFRLRSAEGVTTLLKRLSSSKIRRSKKITTTEELSVVTKKVVNKFKLIQLENLESGNIGLQVYKEYFQSAGFTLIIWCLILYFASQALNAYSCIWLSDWSKEAKKDQSQTGRQQRNTTNLYISVYGALGGAQAITVLIGTLSLTLATIKSAAYLHERMLNRVLRAPMWYFDTTPLGRLVNRFSKDVDTVDIMLPLNFPVWLNQLLSVVSTFIVISYSTPIFIAFIIPVGIFYIFLQRFYVATSRQLKRLESITRSPIYSYFSETISGATTIRAFGLEEDFITESDKKIDANQQAYYPFIASNLWIAARLETIGSLIIFAAAISAVISRDSIEPGTVGLSVSYALQVTSLLNYLVRLTSELETNIVSVERMLEITQVPQEANWQIFQNKPKPEWPENGELNFENYQTRYREGLDLVLKGITCKINPKEKVGIVGRTGAGKSSLTLALFRLVEPSSGHIIIDGIDISTLGLQDLRTKLTIIPQDPVLFSGTLRFNLDPFEKNSDDRIWECLRLAHLNNFVKTLPEGLSYTVAEEGSNFSVGQKQLICLARALLRKTKILVLDEASSSLDMETDGLLQKTIKSEFYDYTVITIAHRLNTIMDSDRVIVLDKGLIKEFDTPNVLLRNTQSIFYGLAKETELV